MARSQFIDPKESGAEQPPLGQKLLLLTKEGVAVIGKWEFMGYLGWSPLPDVPESIKRKRDGGQRDASL